MAYATCEKSSLPHNIIASHNYLVCDIWPLHFAYSLSDLYYRKSDERNCSYSSLIHLFAPVVLFSALHQLFVFLSDDKLPDFRCNRSHVLISSLFTGTSPLPFGSTDHISSYIIHFKREEISFLYSFFFKDNFSSSSFFSESSSPAGVGILWILLKGFVSFLLLCFFYASIMLLFFSAVYSL